MIAKARKENIVQKLLITNQKATALRTRLLIQGETDKADEVQIKGKQLANEIEKLLAEMMSNWAGNADALVQDITGLNTNLQSTINNVKERSKTAQQVVKAVSLIDDAISIAKSFL